MGKSRTNRKWTDTPQTKKSYTTNDIEYYHDQILNFLKNEGTYLANNTLVSEKSKLFSKIEKNTGIKINYMGNAISPNLIKDSNEKYFITGDMFENPKWKTKYTVMLGAVPELDGTKTLKTKPHLESNSGDLYFKEDFTKTVYVDLERQYNSNGEIVDFNMDKHELYVVPEKYMNKYDLFNESKS